MSAKECKVKWQV